MGFWDSAKLLKVFFLKVNRFNGSDRVGEDMVFWDSTRLIRVFFTETDLAGEYLGFWGFNKVAKSVFYKKLTG